MRDLASREAEERVDELRARRRRRLAGDSSAEGVEGLAEWLGRLQVRAGPMEGGAWLVPGWAVVQVGNVSVI